MDFTGLSRESLQDALLVRLGKLAGLRKESKQFRARLGDVRSEIALLHHELTLIEEQLKRIMAMPQAVPDVKETKVLRVKKTA